MNAALPSTFLKTLLVPAAVNVSEVFRCWEPSGSQNQRFGQQIPLTGAGIRLEGRFHEVL